MRRILSPFMILVLAVTLVSCDSSLETGPEGGDNVEIRFSQTSAAAVSSSVAASVTQAFGNVDLEEVGALTAQLTRVEALLLGADEEGEDEAWVSIPLTDAVEIDFLNLPTSEANALVLPTGDLEAGTYHNLRLYVEDAVITFLNAVTIGLTTWDAGTGHPLRIPGPDPDDPRVLVPTAAFTIGEGTGATIDVVFDAATSISSIAATPFFILMAPALSAEVDDDDEDDDDDN